MEFGHNLSGKFEKADFGLPEGYARTPKTGTEK